MASMQIGAAIHADDAREALELIQSMEKYGVHAAWMTNSGARLDGISVMAVAASHTQRIKLGTSIVPTYPRHPLTMAAQARVVADLAPGRFRLGIGPSHRPNMEAMGMSFHDPLGHLREYLEVLNAILKTGSVDFKGRYYRACDTIPAPLDMLVMAAALRRNAFELCGGLSDGAITWLCPGPYLRDVALPALNAGAAAANRPPPPLIAHVPVCVHDDEAEVRAAVRAQIMNVRLPFYQQMFADAGYPEAVQGAWSDRMIDGVVLWGSEARVAGKLREFGAWGGGEILASIVTAGPDRKASRDRCLRLLGEVARAG
ncbi:MAG: LLM class flavin-dependent oxidoreductase [Betaproteobacteria bacterium]|nr:LLM class flavin-dependent oxidoreductase [Betaproteobacteria bacterium]